MIHLLFQLDVILEVAAVAVIAWSLLGSATKSQPSEVAIPVKVRDNR